MSLYRITEEYLIETFDPNNTESVFTGEHSQELDKRLLSHDPDYRADVQKKEEIHRAVNNFYRNTAKAALFFKGTDQIILRLIPYKTDPDETAHIRKITAYLESISEELEQEEREKNILLIPENPLAKMEQILHELPTPVDSHRILRKAFSQALHLDKRDSVFFMNGKAVVRFFQRSDVERRFEGLPAEEIKKIAEELYPPQGENEMAGDLDMVISTLSDTALNFAEIDNLFFNTRHIKIIQEGLVRFFKDKISQNETVIKALANYIFRESFYYIHEILAEKLLELIERKDKNAETFLRYYNGSTFIQNGEKHVTPEIVDEGGQKWNIAAVVNFMSQFSKNKTQISKKETSIRIYRSEEKELAPIVAESTRLQDAAASEKTHSPDMLKKIQKLVGKNRKVLTKDHTDHSNYSLEGLSPEEIYEEFQKSIRDMNKRIDFLHMRIDSDQKAIDEIRDKFAEQQKQYDMLIIAISEVLMDRKTPAEIRDEPHN